MFLLMYGECIIILFSVKERVTASPRRDILLVAMGNSSRSRAMTAMDNRALNQQLGKRFDLSIRFLLNLALLRQV